MAVASPVWFPAPLRPVGQAAWEWKAWLSREARAVLKHSGREHLDLALAPAWRSTTRAACVPDG